MNKSIAEKIGESVKDYMKENKIGFDTLGPLIGATKTTLWRQCNYPETMTTAIMQKLHDANIVRISVNDEKAPQPVKCVSFENVTARTMLANFTERELKAMQKAIKLLEAFPKIDGENLTKSEIAKIDKMLGLMIKTL